MVEKILTSAPNRTSFPVAKPRFAAVRSEADIFEFLNEKFKCKRGRERERERGRERKGRRTFLLVR